MDATRFDALSRTVSATASRRGLLAGLIFGLLAVVPCGFGRGDAQAKKKRKKKKKKKKKPPVCVPESQVATCAGRCGTWPNNCGQYVSCPACTDGKVCLGNGSCGLPCGGDFGGCPASCICDFGTPEGRRYCIQVLPGCPPQPACDSTAQCPFGSLCHDAPPPPMNCGRTCWPVCGA